MMHLRVEDANAWRRKVEEAALSQKYGVKVSPVEARPWDMRDFALHDSAGVLWRIAENDA